MPIRSASTRSAAAAAPHRPAAPPRSTAQQRRRTGDQLPLPNASSARILLVTSSAATLYASDSVG